MLTKNTVPARLNETMTFENPDGTYDTLEAGTEITIGVLPTGEVTGADLSTENLPNEALVGYYHGECFFIAPHQFTRVG